MGIFKRKSDENFKMQLEKEALDKMNNSFEDDFTLPIELEGEDSVWNIRSKAKAPHTITADELNNKKSLEKDTSVENSSSDIVMSPDNSSSESPSSFLYQRMIDSRNKNLEKATVKPEAEPVAAAKAEEVSPSPAVSEPLDIDEAIKSLKEVANIKSKSYDVPPSKEQVEAKPVASPVEQASPLSKTPEKPTAEERRTSLLARCNAYLEDEEFGTAKIDKEKYKLESVESILEGFENRAAQRVKNKFNYVAPKDVTVPSGKNSSLDLKETKTNVSDTVLFEMSSVKNEETKPIISEEPVKQEPEVKHFFVALTPEVKDFDDISSTRVVPAVSKSELSSATALEDKTSIFTAVSSVSNSKKDLDAEEDYNESQVLEDEINDYKSISDRDTVLTSLKHSKSRLSIRAFLTFILIIPSILLLTPISETLTANGMLPVYIAEIIISFLAIAFNFNIIKSVVSLFNHNDDPDLPAALSIIGTTLFSIMNLAFDGKFSGMSLVSLFTLLIFNLTKRNFYSRTINNFAIIGNSDNKKAVAIIKNSGATKTIVGNSIEGGALVCCGVNTTNVQSFLKYTYCADPTASKIKKLSLVGLIFAVGFAASSMFLNYESSALPFAVFSAILAITAAPATLLLSNLPFKIAQDRLKLYDAMLTGYSAAEEFDLCNGIALNCRDLFPDGTIRLVDMKLLSPNPFDQSILEAAAVCEKIGSPLAGIFKQVKTTSSYTAETPVVDSVIYEEKMGVSGWVNDRRVFVGNRNLMEAHGFSGLPPLELDKKIMRKGYFPVYLASDNVPCALLVVKYSIDQDVGYELRRLCNTGTTILVNNCDPNISANMLCDYFGVYDDAIHIMNKQGSDQFDTITKHKENVSAGAAYNSNAAGLFAVLTASINVKKSISAMTVLCIICVILGITAIGVSVFATFTQFISPLYLLLFQIVATLVTCLPPILRKP